MDVVKGNFEEALSSVENLIKKVRPIAVIFRTLPSSVSTANLPELKESPN